MFEKIRQSLQLKLTLPIVIGTVVVVTVAVWYMFRVKEQNTRLVGVTTARAVANQITTLRTFYTTEVASRAKENNLKLNYDFSDKRDTLPLPATLVNTLGAQIEKDYPGTKVRLYSKYPFPHRVKDLELKGEWNGKGYVNGMDGFERDAAAALDADPKTPFYRLEDVNGRLSVRYATADLMRSSCVQCHNNHAESPRRGWKEGDVRGYVEVVVPVDEANAGLQQSAFAVAGVVVGGSLVLACVIYAFIRRWVLRPVGAIEGVFQEIGMGNFQARVPVETTDELGQMSGNFNAMLENVVSPLFDAKEQRDLFESELAKAVQERCLDTTTIACDGDSSAQLVEQLHRLLDTTSAAKTSDEPVGILS